MPNTSPKTNSTRKVRKIIAPKHRSFRLEKRIARPKRPPLAGGFRLLRTSLGLIKRNWKLFLGITAVYAVLNLMLVQSFFGLDLNSAKQSVGGLGGQWAKVTDGISVMNYLFGASGTANSTSAYRLILMAIGSLAIIWTLRQLYAGSKIRIRDSFYAGMYPLVPFMLVFLVISLQLIPITLGMYLYSVVGAASGVESILWGVILLAASVLTFYMLSSSIFALYIACLPGMTPMASLRSALQLVRHRRLAVVRRLLTLPLIAMILLAVVMIPLIAFAMPLVSVVFFVFLMAILPVTHGYVYALYRELLRE